MTDKERIERLEKVLWTLISWLYRELGEQSTIELLEMLNPATRQEARDDQ